MAKKTPRLRKYRVSWITTFCGFKRCLTLAAQNKQQAAKLVSDRYPSQKRPSVSCIK